MVWFACMPGAKPHAVQAEVKNVIADVYGRLYGMNAHVRKMAASIAAGIKTEHVTMGKQGVVLGSAPQGASLRLGLCVMFQC
jgi:hypothetical protein